MLDHWTMTGCWSTTAEAKNSKYKWLIAQYIQAIH